MKNNFEILQYSVSTDSIILYCLNFVAKFVQILIRTTIIDILYICLTLKNKTGNTVMWEFKISYPNMLYTLKSKMTNIIIILCLMCEACILSSTFYITSYLMLTQSHFYLWERTKIVPWEEHHTSYEECNNWQFT